MARSTGKRRRSRSRAAEVVVGVSCLGLGVTAVVVPLLAARGEQAPVRIASIEVPTTEAAVPAVPGPPPAEKEEEKPAKRKETEFSDKEALAYFDDRWDDETHRHITDIRTSGTYLRIYTDLPESKDNSPAALRLCERGMQYLGELGVAKRVVFVQARTGGNGNPVLANVLGPKDDDCRVTYPKPKA
ncbi:hypothetical protein [Herbidospora cretacea]|uniref:hypothetical protein n=1 Tax=Herbidospora cretacea TaxID=28444 RepID=UPI000A5F88FE|nr:hypothetical protein [Herbidospora cretacea]